MKPYYLKNAGEYHSRLTTKLAVLLLASSAVGAFADPNVTATLDMPAYDGAAATLTPSVTYTAPAGDPIPTSLRSGGSNGIVLGASYGTNSAAYVAAGHPSAPFLMRNITIYTSGGKKYVGAVTYDMVAKSGSVGAPDNPWILTGSTSISIGEGISIWMPGVTQIAIGSGTTGYGASAYSNSNALTLSKNANMQVSGIPVVVGYVGNKNSFTVDQGSSVSSATLAIGVGAGNVSMPADENVVTVKGSSTSSAYGSTVSTNLSAWVNEGDLTIGSYGSKNSLKVSDGAYFDNADHSVSIGDGGASNTMEIAGKPAGGKAAFTGGDLTLGISSASNAVSFTSSKAALGAVLVGQKASATANTVTIKSSDVSVASLTLGSFGSSNALTVSSWASLASAGAMVIGNGDSVTGKCNSDGTEGYAAAEGSSNTATFSDVANVTVGGDLYVGNTSSSNTLTVSGGSMLTKVANRDWNNGGVVTDTVAIANVYIGVGGTNGDYDVTAAGDNNTVTVTGAKSMLAVANIEMGKFGSSNKLVIADGAYLGANVDAKDAKILAPVDTLTIGAGADGIAELLRQHGVGLLQLTIGAGADGIASAKDDTKQANANAVEISASKAKITGILVGGWGSNNSLTVKSASSLEATSIILGAFSNPPSDLLSTATKSSRGNTLVVDGEKTVVNSTSIVVGANGVSNSMNVEAGANVVASTLSIGTGSITYSGYGDGNNVLVTGSNSIVKVANLYVGKDATNSKDHPELVGYASNNSLTVEDGGLVVMTSYPTLSTVNTDKGDENVIRLKDGFIAIKGKLAAANEDSSIDDGSVEVIFGDDLTKDSGKVIHYKGLLDKGAFEVWNGTEYVPATSSTLSVTYYSNSAEAEQNTGYTGLAGYTVITNVIAPAKPDLSWAGSNLFDNKDGWYCSTWYGWFYSTEDSGNFIMSSTADSWQYVAPGSTPASAYFYDYKLGSWIYTDSTHFQKNWVYEYATSSWIQLGK